jgi:DNA-binding XRE family transcriptional regulator
MAWSIKAARVNAGLTQKEAAKALGVSETTVMKWEKGASVPLADKFVEMCRLYNVSMDDVFLPQRVS